MRGWFAGPKVVAEAYGAGDLDDIIRQYQPDLVELSVADVLALNPAGIKLILAVPPGGFDRAKHILDQHRSDIAYVLVSGTATSEELRALAAGFSVLVQNPETGIEQLIERPGVGVALKGSTETRPGYKHYDELARVLELLEEP
jgi:hypothetical protein